MKKNINQKYLRYIDANICNELEFDEKLKELHELYNKKDYFVRRIVSKKLLSEKNKYIQKYTVKDLPPMYDYND